LCYLSYCHYNNNGKPSFSTEARNANFPYKNLKISDHPEQDKRSKFVWDKLKTIFGKEQNPDGHSDDEASVVQMFHRLSEIITNCQILTKVGGNGLALAATEQPKPSEDARDFSTLHFLRNVAVHRNMVDVAVKLGRLYINLTEGWHETTTDVRDDRENNPNWQSIPIDPGFWIIVPPVALNGQDHTAEPLLKVVPRLISFVKRTRDALLQLAFPQHYNTIGGIPPFHDDKVRRGLNDGVRIGQEYHSPWENFDEKCYINNDNFDSNLWAV
jgi:hypothetical protein